MLNLDSKTPNTQIQIHWYNNNNIFSLQHNYYAVVSIQNQYTLQFKWQ